MASAPTFIGPTPQRWGGRRAGRTARRQPPPLAPKLDATAPPFFFQGDASRAQPSEPRCCEAGGRTLTPSAQTSTETMPARLLPPSI
eukprot:scaffold23021_cov135-Isochrysis_galbana.AAC.2